MNGSYFLYKMGVFPSSGSHHRLLLRRRGNKDLAIWCLTRSTRPDVHLPVERQHGRTSHPVWTPPECTLTRDGSSQIYSVTLGQERRIMKRSVLARRPNLPVDHRPLCKDGLVEGPVCLHERYAIESEPKRKPFFSSLFFLKQFLPGFSRFAV